MHKLGISAAVWCQIPPSAEVLDVIHRSLDVEAVENPERLPKRLQKAVDQAVEICVLFPQFFDLLDGVDDRGVMFTSKAASNFRQRCMRRAMVGVESFTWVGAGSAGGCALQEMPGSTPGGAEGLGEGPRLV